MRKVWGGVMSASGLTGERVMETWRSRSRLSGGESGSCGGGRGGQMPGLWRFVSGVVSMGVVGGVKGTVSGGVSGGVSSSMSSLSSMRSEVYVVIGRGCSWGVRAGEGGGASLQPWSYQVEWVHEGRVWFRLGALVGGGLEGGGVLLVGEGLRIHGYG